MASNRVGGVWGRQGIVAWWRCWWKGCEDDEILPVVHVPKDDLAAVVSQLFAQKGSKNDYKTTHRCIQCHREFSIMTFDPSPPPDKKPKTKPKPPKSGPTEVPAA